MQLEIEAFHWDGGNGVLWVKVSILVNTHTPEGSAISGTPELTGPEWTSLLAASTKTSAQVRPPRDLSIPSCERWDDEGNDPEILVFGSAFDLLFRL